MAETEFLATTEEFEAARVGNLEPLSRNSGVAFAAYPTLLVREVRHDEANDRPVATGRWMVLVVGCWQSEGNGDGLHPVFDWPPIASNYQPNDAASRIP